MFEPLYRQCILNAADSNIVFPSEDEEVYSVNQIATTGIVEDVRRTLSEESADIIFSEALNLFHNEFDLKTTDKMFDHTEETEKQFELLHYMQYHNKYSPKFFACLSDNINTNFSIEDILRHTVADYMAVPNADTKKDCTIFLPELMSQQQFSDYYNQFLKGKFRLGYSFNSVLYAIDEYLPVTRHDIREFYMKDCDRFKEACNELGVSFDRIIAVGAEYLKDDTLMQIYKQCIHEQPSAILFIDEKYATLPLQKIAVREAPDLIFFVDDPKNVARAMPEGHRLTIAKMVQGYLENPAAAMNRYCISKQVLDGLRETLAHDSCPEIREVISKVNAPKEQEKTSKKPKKGLDI